LIAETNLRFSRGFCARAVRDATSGVVGEKRCARMALGGILRAFSVTLVVYPLDATLDYCGDEYSWTNIRVRIFGA
jgi:hypothetical protein